MVVNFDAETGLIHEIIRRYSGFEDPGFPLADQIIQITGISNDDLAGKSFDDELVEADIANADLIVAHNAPFDRGFLELRFPSFKHKWWACSQRECPWQEMLTGSSKLEFLANVTCGFFYSAHRALTDAEALLHILATLQFGDSPVFKYLMEKTRIKTYRVWAQGAPYDKKDVLKVDNGYKWSDGTDSDQPIKAWFKDGIVDLQVELEMLSSCIYDKRHAVTVDELTGRERFTERQARRHEVLIEPEPVNRPS